MEAYIRHQASDYEFSRMNHPKSSGNSESLISERASTDRRPVHGLSSHVWSLSNNILTQVKQIGVLLENSTRTRDEGIKELPHISSQILSFWKGLCP